MCLPKSATVSSRPGTMPRTYTPRTAEPVESSPCACTKGAAATTPGWRATDWATASQSRRPASGPITWMWAAAPRMRARTSFSNPFITDITVMSAAMPSAMPSIDTSEMKEMKCVRRLARV